MRTDQELIKIWHNAYASQLFKDREACINRINNYESLIKKRSQQTIYVSFLIFAVAAILFSDQKQSLFIATILAFVVGGFIYEDCRNAKKAKADQEKYLVDLSENLKSANYYSQSFFVLKILRELIPEPQEALRMVDVLSSSGKIGGDAAYTMRLEIRGKLGNLRRNGANPWPEMN